MDLDPKVTPGYGLYTAVGVQQTNALRALIKKQAEKSDVVDYVKNNKIQSTSEMINKLQPTCSKHKGLEHKNRMQYRREFYQMLPKHQLLNFAQKTLSKKGEFDALQELAESIDAEPARHMSHWDFFVDALGSGCICKDALNQDFADEVSKLVVGVVFNTVLIWDLNY